MKLSNDWAHSSCSIRSDIFHCTVPVLLCILNRDRVLTDYCWVYSVTTMVCIELKHGLQRAEVAYKSNFYGMKVCSDFSIPTRVRQSALWVLWTWLIHKKTKKKSIVRYKLECIICALGLKTKFWPLIDFFLLGKFNKMIKWNWNIIFFPRALTNASLCLNPTRKPLRL